MLPTFSAGAQDATWLSNPGSNDLNSGPNWSTGTVPTGTASFGASNTTALILSAANNTFSGWTFTAGASAYSISMPFGNVDFVGAGITINGGSVSILTSFPFNGVNFANGSTAGGAQITNDGFLNFLNASSAGTATITNNELQQFSGTSSADHATIVNQQGLSFNWCKHRCQRNNRQ